MPLRKANPVTVSPEQLEVEVAIAAVHAPKLAQPEKSHASPYHGGDAKGRQISRQGLFQAALQSPAIMQYCPDLPSYLKMVREVAEAGLAFVNE